MGSRVLRPVTGQWVNAFGGWHRGRDTTFGYVDGHVSKYSWQSQELVDWCNLALEEPQKFSFYRFPENETEWQDFRWAVLGYPYKALTGREKYGL